MPTLSLLLGACGNSDKLNGDTTDKEKPTITFTAPVKELTGNVTIAADAKDNVKVAKVDFYDNGNLVVSKTDAPYQFTTTYTASNNGQHIIKAVATDSSGNSSEITETITVNIATVSNDTTKPTVELVAPAKINSSTPVVFTVNASDNVKISKVEIYKDDVLLKAMDSSPYQYTKSYNSSNNGKHTIKVVVTDSSGNQASTSQVVEVNVEALPSPTPKPIPDPKPTDTTIPTLKITIPDEITATDTPLSAVATDNIKVDRVEFYDNGKLISTVSESPYTYNLKYTNIDNGDHIIKVVAIDTAGNKKEESKTVKLNIKAPDTENPTVTLTAPATVNTSDEISFSADAKDNEGISSVEFYDNDTLIKKLTAAPYNVSTKYDTSAEGKHTIKAIAYDNSGNKTEATNEVIVDFTKPTVDFTIPANTVSINSYTLNSTVEAKDNIAVAKVEVYDNDKLISTTTEAPYTISQKYTESGQHNMKVVVTDSAGNQTEKSSPIDVKVIGSNINTERQLKTHESRQLTSDLPGTLTWTSSQPDVIAVSPTGEVTGLRLTVDPVTITATAADGLKQDVQLTTYGLELTMCTFNDNILMRTTGKLRLCALTKFRTKNGAILGDSTQIADRKAISIVSPTGKSVALNNTVRPSGNGMSAVMAYNTDLYPEAGIYTASVNVGGETYQANVQLDPSMKADGILNPGMQLTADSYQITGSFGNNTGAVWLSCYNATKFVTAYVGSISTSLPTSGTHTFNTTASRVRCDYVSYTVDPYSFATVTPKQVNIAWQQGKVFSF